MVFPVTPATIKVPGEDVHISKTYTFTPVWVVIPSLAANTSYRMVRTERELSDVQKASRRQFLTQVGSGPVLLIDGDWWESTLATYPPYPEIAQEILDEQGWVQRSEHRENKEDALWSIRTFEWEWLRSRVRESTNGIVDIPLGGIFAVRIGNDEKTHRIRGNKITDGRTFAFPNYAKSKLEDPIDRTYKSYIDDFSKVGFSNVGHLDWRFGPSLPTSVGFYSNVCRDGGDLNVQTVGAVQPIQHYLEYELRDDTANLDQTVSLPNTVILEFHGWVASWTHQDQIYVVVGIHPNDQEGLCGLTAPHLEKALNEIVEEKVDLRLDESLYGRISSVMGAVK